MGALPLTRQVDAEERLEPVRHVPTIVALATPQQDQCTVAYAPPQQGLCLREAREAREEASRAYRAESKPCRSASHTGYPSRTLRRPPRRDGARPGRGQGAPRALDPHPTGRFVEERKKPGIETKRIGALGPSESLRYRK
jgi:hypothetical protein